MGSRQFWVTILKISTRVFPFSFDTFGFLAPKVVAFSTRVQQVVNNNFSAPKTQSFVSNRIDGAACCPLTCHFIVTFILAEYF